MNRNIIVYSFFSIVLLVVLEQIFGFSYIPKQILRISLFVVIPLYGIYFIRKSNIKTEIKFEKPTLKELKLPLILSAVIFLGTVGGYFMLQFMFDAESSVRGGEELGITPDNIFIWAFYLCFINSLVEEFFFRGYIFYTLEKKSYKLAIIVSSLLWSIYHVIIFITIFQIYTVIFTLVGLFIIGVMLAYINKFGKSFINSWMVHIAADIGVVVVLLYMYTLV